MASSSPLQVLEARTLAHYQANAEAFWEGTRDHDVQQNYAALLEAIEAQPPLRILDFGCGPGRDLVAFRDLGHEPVGLDGCAAFVEMARARSGCQVLHQSFLALDLPGESFHGVFANASLFHVPEAQLPKVLMQLRDALRPGGVLFCSNPRAFEADSAGFNGERYGCYLTVQSWTRLLSAAGLLHERSFLRPNGKPENQQPWSAMVWRRPLLARGAGAP